MEDKKEDKNQDIKSENKESDESGNSMDYERSAIYIKNKETGEWEVRNPSGSIGYNYLYRED